MTNLGVSRLVITSAYPLVARTPRLPLAVLRVALAGTYADLAQMERVVSGSGLAWTIVRLNRLMAGAGIGGLSAALALHRHGITVRGHAALAGNSGTRSPDGRWLTSNGCSPSDGAVRLPVTWSA